MSRSSSNKEKNDKIIRQGHVRMKIGNLSQKDKVLKETDRGTGTRTEIIQLGCEYTK